MQAHDSVAGQEMAEENVAQYHGETVKLVRLEKTRDTPLVRLCCYSFLPNQFLRYSAVATAAVFLWLLLQPFFPHSNHIVVAVATGFSP